MPFSQRELLSHLHDTTVSHGSPGITTKCRPHKRFALSGCVVVPELLWRSHIESSRGENDPDTSILWRHTKEYYWRESDNHEHETSQLPSAKKHSQSQPALPFHVTVTCRPDQYGSNFTTGTHSIPYCTLSFSIAIPYSIGTRTGVGLFSEKVRHPTPSSSHRSGSELASCLSILPRDFLSRLSTVSF